MDDQYSKYVDARNSTVTHVEGDQYIVTQQNGDSLAQILRKLQPANMDASARPECLPGTRSAVIGLITNWAFDPDETHNIMWLHGLAGAGKSALSTTIANRFREQGNLGAFVFFNRDVTERSDPLTVVRTLAYQLSSFDPQIAQNISAVIQDFPNVHLSPLHLQFQKLLIEPLNATSRQDKPIIIILEALDECGTPEKREMLLEILSEQADQLPQGSRILITSRMERDIRGAFESLPNVLVYELDITTNSNANDVSTYLRYRMTRISKKTRHLWPGIEWPTDELIQMLTTHASGLFVWASTATQFIDGHDPRKRMELVLHGDASMGAGKALDVLYRTALDSAGSWDDEDFVEDFRAILGVVLVALDPLSTTAIDLILGLPDGRPSAHTVSQLGCVLQQEPTVRLLHPSFGDFLTNKARCRRDIWYFNPDQHNRTLAIQCLRRMETTLKRNMCHMTLSADLEDQHLPEDITYACRFWISHVCAIKGESSSVLAHLSAFLRRHLLHWFEAMSILRRSRETILTLDRLLGWVRGHTSLTDPLYDLVKDAWRFSSLFAHSIEHHPLLVYNTALPFAPTDSSLYKIFHDSEAHPMIAGGFQSSWSPVLLVLAGHEDDVDCISYSPDGRHVVSASWDNTIRIWDAILGVETLPPLKGHDEAVLAVAFSPDGKRIVSGSFDTTVRLWNAITGVEILIMGGHTGLIRSVAYSPDGTKVVSGSADKTIGLWDCASGKLTLPLLQGHDETVHSVSFSPDSARIASASDDWTLGIWSASTGALLLPRLRGHKHIVRGVEFSPNGELIVSGSDDKTVRIWNSKTGEQITAMTGHDDIIQSVGFAPDGDRVVSASSDKTIRVWDIATGMETVPALRGHEDVAGSVAFSPDGTRIASGSNDHTLRIWDAMIGVETSPVREDEEEWVGSVAFTPDGSHIVSNSVESGTRVWDAKSGLQIIPHKSFEDDVLDQPYSPLNCSHDGWIVDSLTQRTVSRLPTGIRPFASAAHGRTVAIGTRSGRLLVIHHPPAHFIGPETRVIEDKGRTMYLLEGDSSSDSEDEGPFDDGRRSAVSDDGPSVVDGSKKPLDDSSSDDSYGTAEDLVGPQ